MEEGSYALLGQSIFGCIVIAIAGFAIYQYIGKQWMAAQFASRLSAVGREHTSMVEKLRLEIEALRAARKLQELDFSALPGTWERLEKSYNSVKSILKFGEYKIDVEHLNVFELGEMMGTMEWFQSEINRVKALDGFARQDEFDDIRFAYQVRKVREICRELGSFLAANAICYPAEMLAELNALSTELELVLGAKQRLGFRAHGADVEPPALDEKFTARMNAMTASIRKKLESHEETIAS